MERCCAVVIVCLGLLLIRAPLTLSERGLAHADDCPGSYKTWPGYTPGTGGVCKTKLGIDPNSHLDDCKAGQSTIKLCDDRAGGQYKTCELSCSGSSVVKKAEQALKAALAALASLEKGADGDLASMQALLNEIAGLLNVVNQNSSLLGQSIATLNASLAQLVQPRQPDNHRPHALA